MLRHVWLMALVFLLGCGQAEKPSAPAQDPDDLPITEADMEMPASYADAVPRIKSYRDAIRGAVFANTPTKAHRPLDELTIVLDNLPSIAKKSGIPIEQWETINLTAQELQELFEQIHTAIDSNRDANYQTVAEPIDRAIARLEQVTR